MRMASSMLEKQVVSIKTRSSSGNWQLLKLTFVKLSVGYLGTSVFYFQLQRMEMMKALCKSRTKNYSCTACSEDRNFIDMKLGNLMYEVPVGNSSDSMPLANSLNGVELDTAHPGSHTSDEDSLSWSSSIFSSYASDASYVSQDSGIGKTVPDDLQISLKRQGLTVDDLLESVPPFVVEWQSVRDVSQCLNCASPIDFLSRKVIFLTIVRISNQGISSIYCLYHHFLPSKNFSWLKQK